MTSLKTTLLLLFCLTIGTTIAQPHYDWNDKVQNVYESISSLRMPEARRLNAIEKKNDPNNLVFHLLDSYADLYQLFFNENNIEYNNIYPKFNKRIELLKTGPKNSPYYLFSLASVHLDKAIVAIRFDRNWEAALDFRKAYFLLKQNKEAYPKFTPTDVYFGLMTTIIGAVPNNYQWMLNMMGMKGSISKGNAMVLNYLNSNNEFSNVCKNEALLIYPYLVLNFEGNRKKAIDFIESTNYNFKRNHIHAYMATNIYLSNQQAKKSLDIANGIELNDAYLKMPFWNYEKGFAYLNQLNLEKSHQELTTFVNEFKGNFYIKDAYEKLSWIAYLQNDFKAAAIYRNKLINTGNTITDADKLADDNAKSGKWPNALLLKARLLSDGGLQNQSLGILQGKTMRDFPTDEEKAEFVYRLARIHDLMGSKEQAVKFYKTAIEVGRHLKGYYASRSALQIGLIFEERKEYGNAIIYYTTCLNMKNIAFKNSLDQKAKSGLLRCEKLN